MSKSKKVTIGYRYLFGIHAGIGRRVDSLLEWMVGGRTAWRGQASHNQTIHVYKPDLFGGDKGEGGIEGTLDVMLGADDQPVNSRLAAMLGGLVPAFRGITTVFYDGLVTTLNPYPKPWKFRVRRVLSGWDGPVWYPSKASIPISPGFQTDQSILIALDVSGSMAGARLAVTKDAIAQVLDRFDALRIESGVRVHISVCLWSTSRSSMSFNNATSANFAALKAFVNGASASGNTHFDQAFTAANAWFNSSIRDGRQRRMLFITDGLPTDDSVDTALSIGADILDKSTGEFSDANGTAVDVHGVNIVLSDTSETAKVDNTPSDGVPVVTDANPGALAEALLGTISSVVGMNPAHILYECYTNRDWGRGLDPARLDLDSFAAAADTLHAERFGLCLRWAREDTIANFIAAVLDHIGGSVFTSRRTGRIVLRLIRDDYDPEDLPTFTPDTGLLGIDEDDATATDQAVNHVVVKWHEQRSDEARQVSVENLASIRTHGRRSQTTEYIGIPYAELALRVAQRDLMAFTGGVKKFKVRLDRRGREVGPGGAFRISDPSRGISNIVLRAGRIEDGTVAAGTITITAVQDVFGLPSTSYSEPSPPIWTPPSSVPMPTVFHRVTELSYRDLVRITPPADLTLIDPAAGFVLPLAAKPGALALGFDIATRVGGSGVFEVRAGAEFVPSAQIVGALGPLDTAAVVTGGSALEQVVAGTAALIDDELVRIDSIDLVTGAIEIGRGCVDTTPAPHAAGARIWFMEEGADGSDPTAYLSGSAVEAKLLTRMAGGVLAADDAETLSVAVLARQHRPYPPAGLQLNDLDYPLTVLGDVSVTFVHRDRLLQADQLVDTLVGAIGPEPGTTYELEIYNAASDTLIDTISGVSAGPVLLESGDLVSSTRLQVWAVRDGLRSYQAAQHTFQHISGHEFAVFTASGVFTVPEGITEVDVLVVAGGGGGGGKRAGSLSGVGGGGAGGVRLLLAYAVTPEDELDVVVGLGGAGGVGGSSYSQNGEDSSFNGEIALGGGRGSCGALSPSQGTAGDGGSGGGTWSTSGSPGGVRGSGTPGQGHDGAIASASSNSNGMRNGGGGGAASAGVNGGNQVGGNGGDGVDLETLGFGGAIAFGAPEAVGGGGGGGAYRTSGTQTGGPGGVGGGGTGGGGSSTVAVSGTAGSPGTGGGGGGAGGTSASSGNASSGGDGGSGLVIVRWLPAA